MKQKKKYGNGVGILLDVLLGICISALFVAIQFGASVISARITNIVNPAARAVLQQVGDKYTSTGIADFNTFYSDYYSLLIPPTVVLELILVFLMAEKIAQYQKKPMVKPLSGYTAMFIIGCGVTLNYLISVPIDLTPSLKTLSDATTTYVQTMSVPSLLLFIGLLSPLAEELLFRKIMLGSMLKYGQIKALIISGLFFGIMHGNPFQFMYAFPLGIILGWIYIKSKGNITASFLFHAAINTSSVILEKFGMYWMNVVLVTAMIFAFCSWLRIDANRQKLPVVKEA